mmetsp:Transcript_17218/g.28506  ORF Transcript_17218/g.28506 Transcript_17218/m.28506 type:complete len:263 (-) Transcript_17218:777-1565(-)
MVMSSAHNNEEIPLCIEWKKTPALKIGHKKDSNIEWKKEPALKTVHKKNSNVRDASSFDVHQEDFYSDDRMKELFKKASLEDYLQETIDMKITIPEMFMFDRRDYANRFPYIKPGHRAKLKRAVNRLKALRYSCLLDINPISLDDEFSHMEVQDGHGKKTRLVQESYMSFFNHISLRHGWRKVPFGRRDIEELTQCASEIVVKIRSSLDARAKGIILRKLSGSSHDYLWGIQHPPKGSSQTSKFIRKLVHATFQDATGGVSF